MQILRDNHRMLNDDLVEFGVRKFYNDLSVEDQEQIVIITPVLFTNLRDQDTGRLKLLIYSSCFMKFI